MRAQGRSPGQFWGQPGKSEICCILLKLTGFHMWVNLHHSHLLFICNITHALGQICNIAWLFSMKCKKKSLKNQFDHKLRQYHWLCFSSALIAFPSQSWGHLNQNLNLFYPKSKKYSHFSFRSPTKILFTLLASSVIDFCCQSMGLNWSARVCLTSCLFLILSIGDFQRIGPWPILS